MIHEVMVLCNCEDIEQCRTERYISDIRTLITLYGDPLASMPLGVLKARDIVVQERPAA